MERSLFTAKRVLIWLNLYYPSSDTTIPKRTRMGRRILPLFLIVLILCAITVSLCFIIKFKSTNVEATLFTFVILTVYVGLFYIMAIAFFSRPRIAALLEQLTRIYAASSYFNTILFQSPLWLSLSQSSMYCAIQFLPLFSNSR